MFSLGFLAGCVLHAILSAVAYRRAARGHARRVDAFAAREGLTRAEGETNDSLYERALDAALMRQAKTIADGAIDALPDALRARVAMAEWAEAAGPRGQA